MAAAAGTTQVVSAVSPGHARSEPVGECAAASNGASSSTDVPINVVMPVVILMWFMVEFSVLGSMVVSLRVAWGGCRMVVRLVALSVVGHRSRVRFGAVPASAVGYSWAIAALARAVAEHHRVVESAGSRGLHRRDDLIEDGLVGLGNGWVVGTPCSSSNARGVSAVVMVGPCAVAIAVGWSRSMRRHWPANRSPSARVTHGLSQCWNVLNSSARGEAGRQRRCPC